MSLRNFVIQISFVWLALAILSIPAVKADDIVIDGVTYTGASTASNSFFDAEDIDVDPHVSADELKDRAITVTAYGKIAFK